MRKPLFVKSVISYSIVFMVLMFGVFVNDILGIGPPCNPTCDSIQFDWCTLQIRCIRCSECSNCKQCTAEGCITKCDWRTKCEFCYYESSGGCTNCVGCRDICPEYYGKICCEGQCCGGPGWSCHGDDPQGHPRCCPPNTTFTEGAKGWCCYGPDQTCCNGSCVSSCYILEITEEYIGSCVCGIDGSETCKSNDLEVRNDGFGKELNFYYTCINAPLGQSGLTRCVPNGCTSTLFEAWICKDEMSQVGILACWELNMLFCSLQCSAAATACGSGQHRIVYNYFEDSGRIKKREVISVLDARFGKPIENDIFDIATEFGDYEIIDNRSISPN